MSASSRRTLPPMTFAMSSSSRPASMSASVSIDQPGRIERHRDRAVEVRAERDVLDAGDIDGVADRSGRSRPRRRRRRPSARTRCRARRRSRRSPRSVARRSGCGRCRRRPRTPGVRGDDRPARHRQDVVDRRGRRMRHVDEHAARLHPPDHLAARVGQPALRRRRAPTRRTRCRRSGSATSSGSRRRRRPRRWPGRRPAHGRPRSRGGRR